MEDNNLNALLRKVGGKGPARQIRMTGRIPGVFYYQNDLNIPLSVDSIDLNKLIKGKPALVNLSLDNNESYECIIRDIQRDPVEDDILHFDLMGIKRGQKLTVSVPVKLVEIPVGVKTGGGILQLNFSELNVVCLPKHIPTVLEINVEHLEIGMSITVGDIEFPNLEFLNDPRDTIASVVPPSKIKEPVVEEEEGEEGVEGEEGDEDKAGEETDEKSK